MGCCALSNTRAEQERKMQKKQPILERVSLKITGSLENFFYRFGFTVATHPFKFIIGSFLFTALLALGFINFTQENRPDKLWIPRDSKFVSDTEWLRKNFPSPLRESFAIIAAENVLVPEVMQALMEIHDQVKKISVVDGKRWEDLCFKLPITKFEEAAKYHRRRRSIGTPVFNHHLGHHDHHVHHNHHNHSQNHNASNDDSTEESFVKENLDEFDEAFEDPFFSDGEPSSSSSQSEDDDSDPSILLPSGMYCSFVNSLDEACWEVNPVELWSFNRSLVYNLTRNEIIQVINYRLTSPIFGRKVNYTAELGGAIKYNETTGEIIGAEAIRLKWVVAINQTAVDEGKSISDFSTGETADEASWQWEKAWTELMQNISREMPPGITIYYGNGRSWGDITESLIFEDGMMLVVGFAVMFVYISIMIGRYNMVEQRPWLSIAGITCVGFAVIVAYGIGAMCFLLYGPVNKILPFMLLGIGIDDMFVIMQCWHNLYPNCLSKPYKQSIPERMGMALKHAGVSITVTSLTDIAAFGVGASTIMPGLQSFCIYAAIGIIAVFLLQCTFFVACFAVDQKRLEDRRNGFLPWIKYSQAEFQPSAWSQKSYYLTAFNGFFNRIVFKPLGKALVLSITAGCLGASIYGNTLLKQEFDPVWFLPDESHLALFISKREAMYPGTGNPAFIVAENVNWTASFPNYDNFSNKFKSSDAIYSFENWYDDFKIYANKHFQTDIPNQLMDPSKFQKYMGKFLYSPTGSKHRGFFKLEGNYSCGQDLPSVKMVMMPFRFRKFAGAHEHIPGMQEVRNIVGNVDLTYNTGTNGKIIPWSPAMVTWETDLLIAEELYKNVVFSFLCVLATTFLLLANIRVCFFCGLCVIFTLVNVGGMMHFWGLTIDMISFIDIVLAVGLCVDYAAHIALAFMQCTGSKGNRAKEAVKSIGPAVLNGGFSTFLAILLLANSQSHAFKSFFKIFTVVIIFGLFHGLLFLPVLLSLIGPEPFSNTHDAKSNGLSNSPKPPIEMRPLTNGDSIPNGHAHQPDNPEFHEARHNDETLPITNLLNSVAVQK